MGTKYSFRERRWSPLGVLLVTVLVLSFGGVAYAVVSEAIGIIYTPVVETPELSVLTTIATVAPESDEPPVTLTGNILDDGNSVVTGRGFVWSLTSHGNPGDVTPGNSGYEFTWTEEGVFGVGEFYYQPPDLIPHIDYYGRASAINGVGWSYGNEVVFDPAPPATLATVIANQIPTVVAAVTFIAIFILGIAMVTSGLFIIGIISMLASAILATISISILMAVMNSNF